MINGAHVIIYSTDAEADRAFIREVLEFPYVDVGGGWLIFRLPPAEVAVHPTEGAGSHEMHLLCDDVRALIAELTGKGYACDALDDRRYGLVTAVTLPGGGKLGIYEPRHAKPPDE
jgi:hypothetical protein